MCTKAVRWASPRPRLSAQVLQSKMKRTKESDMDGQSKRFSFGFSRGRSGKSTLAKHFFFYPFYFQGISEGKVCEESRGLGKRIGVPKAFPHLASEIQRIIHVLDNPGDGKFVSMPDLCEYDTALNEQGLSDIHSYRADCLKLSLQQPLEEQVVFYRSTKRVTNPELVTSKSVPGQLLLEHAAEMMHATTCKLPEAD